MYCDVEDNFTKSSIDIYIIIPIVYLMALYTYRVIRQKREMLNTIKELRREITEIRNHLIEAKKANQKNVANINHLNIIVDAYKKEMDKINHITNCYDYLKKYLNSLENCNMTNSQLLNIIRRYEVIYQADKHYI